MSSYITTVYSAGEVEKRAVLAIHNLMEHYGDDTADELNIITKTIDKTQMWYVL